MARPLRREQRLMADINVTSLVDVMIVLLIMFMITAPMSQSGMEVRVPQTEGAPLTADEAIVVSMDEEGRVYIDRTEVRPEALVRRSRRSARVEERIGSTCGPTRRTRTDASWG